MEEQAAAFLRAEPANLALHSLGILLNLAFSDLDYDVAAAAEKPEARGILVAHCQLLFGPSTFRFGRTVMFMPEAAPDLHNDSRFIDCALLGGNARQAGWSDSAARFSSL